MRYSFTPPPGWTRAPFPPPQRGVYLRAPVDKPSPESASILLFEEVAPDGTLAQQVALTIPGPPKHDELRVFVLVDAGAERLPVVFVGGARSLPAHQAALDGLLASIGPLQVAPGLYTRWVE